MNLQPRTVQVVGQAEFLRNAVGTEYKTGGATLDASAFTAAVAAGFVKAGTAVYRDSVSGLYKPWAAETAATEKGAGLTAHDVTIATGQNPIVGVLAAGHPIKEKCTGVEDTFVEATKGRIVFDI